MEEDRGGKAERINPVHHAAVPFEHCTEIRALVIDLHKRLLKSDCERPWFHEANKNAVTFGS
ncbi:hypothetical protein BBB57_16350 [Kosakonia sacchari]|nr:hypothetical protein BBB57_16350 [Kosakonia sacchari]